MHLKKATAWDKLSPPFLCAQAQVQDQLGQLPEALKTLDQAEAGVPDDPHVPYVRAMILARNGHYDEARASAKRALAVRRDFQPALALLQKASSRSLTFSHVGSNCALARPLSQLANGLDSRARYPHKQQRHSRMQSRS